MALTKVTSGVRTLAANEVATSNIADNAVTLGKLAHGTDGNLFSYDASGAPVHVSTGNANEVLVSNGAGAAPTFQSLSGLQRVVQQVYATDATYASTTDTFPLDDTIPQNTEGAEAVTVAITPTSASNYLLVEAGGMFTNSSSTTCVVLALFQDSTADAIAASGHPVSSASNANSGSITHRMAAGTTSATTFKLRFAGQSGTTYRNGTSSARLFGGRTNSWIMVTEIAA
tara:strand:- start:2562 stop:3248 length:687 start_codon:yes stop_codon:yes gene_type:complete